MSASLIVTRAYAAPPEAVFDAWLDAESVAQFLFVTPAGVMEKVEVDPRVGGGFIIAGRRGDLLATHRGTYLELERPRRLAFDFSIGADIPATRVSIAIAPSTEGCDLTLTHDGVWPDYAERTRAGWTGILEGLARALGAHGGNA